MSSINGLSGQYNDENTLQVTRQVCGMILSEVVDEEVSAVATKLKGMSPARVTYSNQTIIEVQNKHIDELKFLLTAQVNTSHLKGYIGGIKKQSYLLRQEIYLAKYQEELTSKKNNLIAALYDPLYLQSIIQQKPTVPVYTIVINDFIKFFEKNNKISLTNAEEKLDIIRDLAIQQRKTLTAKNGEGA